MATISWPTLRDTYANLLATMEVRPSWEAGIERAARRLIVNRDRYQSVSDQTGVPWEMIAVIHNLEGGMNFGTHLHNGDSLQRKTVHVPKGRPQGTPPFSWEESACDALTYEGFEKVNEWTDERICYELERYNGMGYRTRNKGNSPYLWSGTNHYTKGKFTSDGHYDSNVVSEQIGAIPLLMKIRDLTQETHKEVRAQVLSQSSTLTWVKNIRNFAAGGGLMTWWASSVEMFKDWMEQLKGFVADNLLVVTVVAIVAIWLIFKFMEYRSVKSYQRGEWGVNK